MKDKPVKLNRKHKNYIYEIIAILKEAGLEHECPKYPEILYFKDTKGGRRFRLLDDGYIHVSDDNFDRWANSTLPAHLPTYKRIWRNVQAERNVDGYVTHTGGGGNEMMVYVRTASSTDTARELRARVRESATGPWFQFQSDVFSAAGNRWQHLYLHVPSGWQYAILSTSGVSNSTIDAWFEMW